MAPSAESFERKHLQNNLKDTVNKQFCTFKILIIIINDKN